MKRTYSAVECNTCDWSIQWPENWTTRYRKCLVKRHLRTTGHATATLRQRWDWD